MMIENIGDFLTPFERMANRMTASKCESPIKGQKINHFNLAERGYIIGIREGQTKSSATDNIGGI